MDDYGSDIAGIEDIDAELSFVDGLRCYAEDLVRRLGTVPGSVEDDPTCGYDLTLLIGSVVDAPDVERKIVEQMLYDDRTASATSRVVQLGGNLDVNIRVEPKGGTPFALILGVSELGVELLGIQEAT